MKKIMSILFALLIYLCSATAQTADPDINILMIPGNLTNNTTGILQVSTLNNGGRDIVANSLRITISVGTNAEITGLSSITDARWTVLGSTTGINNTIRLINSGGTMTKVSGTNPGAVINIVVRARVEGGPQTITGTIGYITGTNPLLPDNAPNASQGNQNTANDNSTTSLTVASGGPLAVSLLDFNATKQNKVVNLNWQTSTEQNSSYFDVEFSKDGTTFEKIGRVNAAGVSNSTKNYSLVHTTPVNGVNYYRLKFVDANTTFKYSAVRIVKFSSSNSIIIMPNPTVDRVFITSDEGGTLQSLGLYSLNGKLLQQVNNFVVGKSIDLTTYSPSVYILKLIDKNGNTEVVKVVKK